MATIHTLPVFDIKEHQEVGFTCFCNPSVQVHLVRTPAGRVEENYHVIHNALDGREWTELADKRNHNGPTTQQ